LVFRAKGVPFGNPSNAAFAACKELVILDVKNAGWTAMGANAFDRNVALAEVLLEHNWLANISSLEKSTALYELNLHNNQIAQLGSFSINTDALQKLKLHSNRLTKIPNIEKATMLQILELNDNLFVEGPDLTKNIRLVRLHLQGNMLTSIPNLATLTKLTTLKLGDNPLGPLPSLDTNTALTELFLNSLSLSSWPSLESLTKLTLLRIRDNRLTTIPAFIGKMSNLKYLDASDNDIQSLDTLTTTTTTAAVATTQSGRNETMLLLARNPVCVNGTIDATFTSASSALGAMWFASCQSQCAGTCNSIPWKPVGQKSNLGDGKCKLGCNTTACSYDGGDCLF
jgi:Leucine-rich repeat (LRR) protein